MKALFQTFDAQQKIIRAPPQSRARGYSSQRGRFTPDEDNLIVQLKTKHNLSWADLYQRFNRRFPGRSKGTLQVRYCTKLKGNSWGKQLYG